MQIEIDIIEDNILKKYPKVLDIILLDQTTKQNIFWATDNYNNLGDGYDYSSQITTESITGINGKVIMPRVLKNKELQRTRVKEMAEVYTPSWICNDQNNCVDSIWFEAENVFNERVVSNDGLRATWKVNKNKISFPKGKTWKDYINNNVLEITCGEAPYLVSRYDTTTGAYISVNNRIGLLDRKLRIIKENIKTKQSWLKYVQLAYKSTYGYEFHGDSLLLARESLLYTFIENHIEKFNIEPKIQDIQKIAYIISWNLWQMDGLKQIVPNSCTTTIKEDKNLFDESKKEIIQCIGCKTDNYRLHNGTYCLIMDWKQNQEIRFVDMLQNKDGK